MLAMAKSSTTYFWIAVLCLSICSHTFALGDALYAAPDDRNSDQVSTLISQLDSKDFQQRELAGEKLIEIGEKAIGPLALKSFECSPEACWRIRKILEQICTRGNETVFYKTNGLLRLRFGEMEKRLSVLESKWKLQQKKQIISRLRKNGAVVNDPLEGKNSPLGPGMPVPLGFVMVNGEFVQQSPNTAIPIEIKRPRKRLSDAEAKKEIEKILESDLEQARKIAIGKQRAKASPKTQNSIDVRQQLGLGRVVVLGGGNLVVGQSQGQGVTLELGDRWKGNANDLKSLSRVVNLTEVKLTALDDSVLEQVASFESLNKLVLENTELTAKDLKKFESSKSIAEIELAKLTVSNELLANVKLLPSLSILNFRQCKFVPGIRLDILQGLKTLKGLQFQGLDISNELFESVGKIPQVSYINLTYCKFKTTGYKTLQKLRPNLQISYYAKAFLGVRGPMDMGQVPRIGGCVISEVIAGSGAAKGGMKVHDVIESVNGQKIEAFEDLRLHIAQHHPGEKLNVTVNRLGKQIDLEIELGNLDEAQP